MVRQEKVPRPTRKNEYSIYFASTSAAKGWRDLAAVRRNDLIEAWEFLTKSPKLLTPLNAPLHGELAHVFVGGTTHECWQLKLSSTYGARIWYYVIESSVFIEAVHTKHPNETK